VQAELAQPTLLGAGDDVVEQVEGIGIPDVIEVTVEDATVWLTVMDIKDSPAPRYAQQWQVAFYAALLRASLQGHTFALPVRVADSDVIVTRQTGPVGEPTRHTFDLDPYSAVLPLLQRRIAGILTTPVLEAPPARFGAGDFLRLNAVGSPDLQEGIPILLARYEPHDQHLAVIARQGRQALSKQLCYTLDEDLEDWTTPRMLHAVREAWTPGKHPHLTALLTCALPLAQPTPGLGAMLDGTNGAQCTPTRGTAPTISKPPRAD
jgi:hypothetical protein